MGAYLLGIDLGTSACKAALFDAYGAVAGQASAAWIQAVLSQWDEIGYLGFTKEEQALFDSFLTRITDNVLEFKRREERNG